MAKQGAFDHPGSLMTATIVLMKDCNLSDLCADTRIPYTWLQKFRNHEFKNPSVNRVQYLYELLAGRKIV